jgi:predicted aspartyl protease
MVDCGATETFIDKKYAEQVGIPLDKKKIPWRVPAVDGREVASGPVTHNTMVKLTTNNHRETIKLYCITIGNLPIILGLPWLKKHNPKINWREGKVMFDSDKCAKECLDTSPHAKTIPEEKAIDQYHLDLAQDTTFDDEENSKDEEEPEGILKEWALYPDHESDSSGDQDNPLEETDTENLPIHQQPTEPKMEY